MISTTSRPPSGSWKASARETKAASMIPFPTKPKGMHWTHYEQRRTWRALSLIVDLDWHWIGTSAGGTQAVKTINTLSLLARPKGFEPLTPRFVVWCSIQLSYGRPAGAREALCRKSRQARRMGRRFGLER